MWLSLCRVLDTVFRDSVLMVEFWSVQLSLLIKAPRLIPVSTLRDGSFIRCLLIYLDRLGHYIAWARQEARDDVIPGEEDWYKFDGKFGLDRGYVVPRCSCLYQ